MSIANGRMTLGSIFGLVTTTANTASSTLDAVNRGVGMLNSFVSNAAEDQAQRAIAHRERFTEQLIEDMAMEDSMRARKIDDFCKDADNKRHFSERYAVYEKLLRKKAD